MRLYVEHKPASQRQRQCRPLRPAGSQAAPSFGQPRPSQRQRQCWPLAAPSFGQPRPISRLGHTLAGHTPAIPLPCSRDRFTYHGVGYMVYWLLRGWAVFAEEMTDWLDCGSCTHINNLAGFISWGSMVKVSPWQCPSSASVPPQGAPGGSRQLNTPTQRDQPTRRPANASGARASHLQSRRSHRL